MLFRLTENCPLCYRPCSNNPIYCIAEATHRIKTKISDEMAYLICECGLIFQMCMMTPEAIREYYNGPYREERGTKEVANKNVMEQLLRTDKVVRFLDDSIVPHSVLDIGSSTGWFLRAMRDIFQCQTLGVELSATFREYSNDLGIRTIEDINQLNGNQCFDMITVLQTLEHFTDPLSLLRKIRELITENGTLLIEVPIHFPGIENNVFSIAHPIVFTEETLETMLNKAGFEIEERKTNNENTLVRAHCET